MTLPKSDIPGVLISLPSLKDPYFEKKIILLFNYNEEGALGIVTNHPTNTTVREVLNKNTLENDLLDQSLLLGGPLQIDTFWALHSTDFDTKSSTQLSKGIKLSSAKDVIMSINSKNKPKICHLGCGYSGWGPNQLDEEIRNESWWLGPLDENLLMETNFNEQWETSLKKIGFDILSAEYVKSGSV